MDKFEEIWEKVKKMSKEERDKLFEKNKRKCICPACPTYTDCAKSKDELMFCAKGKSRKCITREKGCICSECPLKDKAELQHKYFCIKGSEKQQRVNSKKSKTKKRKK